MFLFKENYKTIGKSKRTIITSKIPKNHQQSSVLSNRLDWAV